MHFKTRWENEIERYLVVSSRKDVGEFEVECTHQAAREPLVDAPVGVGSQKGTHDVQADKRASKQYRRPVGARRTSAKQAITESESLIEISIVYRHKHGYMCISSSSYGSPGSYPRKMLALASVRQPVKGVESCRGHQALRSTAR